MRRLLLFVSFSVSGPSDNSVHGKTGVSRDSSFMSWSIPGISANDRLYSEQAHDNINELALPFYQVALGIQEPAYSNHIYNKGIGAGACASVLTHFNETKQN